MKSGGDSFEHGRMLLELQTTKKQLNEAVKKVDQAMKDADYYHGEAENMRGRYNDILLDKQRLEQVISKYSEKKVLSLLIFVTQCLFDLCALLPFLCRPTTRCGKSSSTLRVMEARLKALMAWVVLV